MYSSRFTGGVSGIARRALQPASMLSLDVVAGALLSGLFAATLAGVVFSPVYWLVLALSVWIVYTTDHLVDARRLGEQAHTERHRFAHRYFIPLSVMVALLSMTAVTLVALFLDRTIFWFGLGCGLLAALYFLVILLLRGKKSVFIPRELVVAMIYTAGVWGMPLYHAEHGASWSQWVLMMGFLMLALANTLVFSVADHASDLEDKHQSVAVTHGPAATARIVQGLCLGAAATGVISFLVEPSAVLAASSLIYLLMGGSMMALLRKGRHHGQFLRFRMGTEMVFWLPGLLLLLV